jgi:hypothetical protein
LFSVGRVMATTVCCFAVGVAGCKSVPCPTQARTDPTKALGDHAAQRSGWSAIKAEARVVQWGEKGRIRGTVLMFLQRPGRVRFDVMTQLGPVMVLTSDGDTFQLSDLRAGRFLEGPTCPENIARLLGIPMGADHVVRLLTGQTPEIEAATESMECRGGSYVVTRLAPDGLRQEIIFAVPKADRDKRPQAQRLQLRQSTVTEANGKLRWQATYEDYAEVGGYDFPRTVRFVDRAHGADTTIRVKSMTIDPTIPEEAFEQAPRPGMAVEFAACL